jgi:hypothetical protein
MYTMTIAHETRQIEHFTEIPFTLMPTVENVLKSNEENEENNSYRRLTTGSTISDSKQDEKALKRLQSEVSVSGDKKIHRKMPAGEGKGKVDSPTPTSRIQTRNVEEFLLGKKTQNQKKQTMSGSKIASLCPEHALLSVGRGRGLLDNPFASRSSIVRRDREKEEEQLELLNLIYCILGKEKRDLLRSTVEAPSSLSHIGGSMRKKRDVESSFSLSEDGHER